MRTQFIKSKLLYLFSLGAFFLLSFTACEKDIEDIKNRDQLVGQWDVVENKANPANASVETRDINLAYIVTLARSPVFTDEVYIYNFFDIGNSYYIPAFIEGNDISISKIELRNYTIEGSGTISNDKKLIEWTYWVETPHGDLDQYHATYTFRK